MPRYAPVAPPQSVDKLHQQYHYAQAKLRSTAQCLGSNIHPSWASGMTASSLVPWDASADGCASVSLVGKGKRAGLPGCYLHRLGEEPPLAVSAFLLWRVYLDITT